MSGYSSARRAQVEPLAAIVAVFAVGVGLALYASVLQGTVPREEDRELAEPTLVTVSDRVVENGVVRPDALENVIQVPENGRHEYAPPGHRMRVVLTVRDREWTTGPEPEGTVQAASRRVGVQLAPGRVEPGRLRVEVWK